MFYFPLINTTIPEWFPIWKGEEFEFFRPVFNVADAAISIGFIAIIIFQKKFFAEENKKEIEGIESAEESVS
jgi:signal peptidase II